MMNQLPRMGDLASVFQLVAGVAFAMGVFRSPYERLYHRLGAILDREERLIAARRGQAAVEHGGAVVLARIAWLTKGQELEPRIRRHERSIWASVLLGSLFLVASSLWSEVHVTRAWALAMMASVIAPLLWGVVAIFVDVNEQLAGVKAEIEKL